MKTLREAVLHSFHEQDANLEDEFNASEAAQVWNALAEIFNDSDPEEMVQNGTEYRYIILTELESQSVG